MTILLPDRRLVLPKRLSSRHRQRGFINMHLAAIAGGRRKFTGPLDSYTTSLWSAMSIDCLLTTWIASPPLTAYDVSTTTNHNCKFTTSGAFDSADLLSFGGTHTINAQTLQDQHGNSSHGMDGAGTTTRYPNLATSGSWNGNAQFNGTANALATGVASGTPSGFTVFMRGKLRSTASLQVYLEHSANYNSGNSCVAYYDNSISSTVVAVHSTTSNRYAISSFSGVALNDDVHCYRFDRTQLTGAAMAVLFVNGTKQTRSGSSGETSPLPAGNFDAQNWYVGARAETSLWAQLNLHSMLIYEAALSDADCAAISNALLALA